MVVDTKKFFSDLTESQLEKVYSAAVGDVPKGVKRKALADTLFDNVEKTAFKKLFSEMLLADAQAICETLKIDFKDSSKNNRNVIVKRLSEKVGSDGLEDLLEALSTEQQNTILETLGLEADTSKTTQRAQAQRIVGELRRVGLEVVLSKLGISFLKEVADQFKLDVTDVSSQNHVIQAIVTGKVPKKRSRPEPKEEKFSKTKPKLAAGISVADMMQYYNLDELQEFASENGVVTRGPKKELMKRLAAHFAGEEPPAKKSKAGKGKKGEKKGEKKEEKKEEKGEKKEEKKGEKKEEKKETKKGKKEEKKEEKEDKKEEKAEEKEEGKEKPKKEEEKKGKGGKKGKKEEEKKEEKEAEKKEEKKEEEKKEEKTEEKEVEKKEVEKKEEEKKEKSPPAKKGKKGAKAEK